jgi:hypothetical protein
MRRSLLLLNLLVFTSASLLAQVKVKLDLDQEQYLPGERLSVAVRITNLSGQTLKLGQDQDWLKFTVESISGSMVTKISDPPVAGEFSIESTQVATKRVDIAPFYNLSEIGRYRLTATVKIPQWNQTLTSSSVTFDIINGSVLWQQKFGVPGSSATADGPPEVRTYMLQQANYLNHVQLYVRVGDALGTGTIRVFPIGTMVSFSKPETQLDAESNLHLLNQTGARAFIYCVVNPDGFLRVRQFYDYTSTRPTLAANAQGKINVRGGMRRITAQDLPPEALDNAKPRTKAAEPSP